MHCFTFFPLKHLRDQVWPCHKLGQGQPRVIIYITFVGFKSFCFLPSFKVIWLMVLEKNIFKGFLPYGHAGHLGHVTRTDYINFCSCEALMFYIKSDSNLALWFLRRCLKFDGHSILVTLGQGHWMTLTSDIHNGSYKTYFHFIKYNCFS